MLSGTVYLQGFYTEDGSLTWTGYWEGSEPGPGGNSSAAAGMLEQAPDVLPLVELVAWARARAGRVVVGMPDGQHLWAGTDARPSDMTQDYVPPTT